MQPFIVRPSWFSQALPNPADICAVKPLRRHISSGIRSIYDLIVRQPIDPLATSKVP